MKKLLKLILILSVFILPFSVKAESRNEITIHYFMEYSCPNCKQITEFFDEYLIGKDHIKLVKYDILLDSNHEDLFLKTVDTFDRNMPIVPYVVIGGRDLQGLYEIQSEIEQTIDYYENKTDYNDIVSMVEKNEPVSDEDFFQDDTRVRTVELPILGKIELANFSLFLGAVFIGLIDGFNPCAMWILIFLITLLINLEDRKKIWILGLTFILTSGIIYYIIMMSWLQLVMKVAMIKSFQIFIGILALLFSFFSIKHFWRQHRLDTGCDVTNTRQKRFLMDKAKEIVKAKKLWLAIIGIMGLAISVNIIELACSAGLPVIYSTMLAYHNLTVLEQALYILVYVFFFMLDDLLIFGIAVFTFQITGISNRYTKYSNLLGGLIMLFIGIALIFFPSILL